MSPRRTPGRIWRILMNMSLSRTQKPSRVISAIWPEIAMERWAWAYCSAAGAISSPNRIRASISATPTRITAPVMDAMDRPAARMAISSEEEASQPSPSSVPSSAEAGNRS
jgi:hypothetical protein